jgi:multisubunit Na+/H+ antiporter MnhE subunit
MTQAALRVVGLAAIYLLVLTSLDPGDLLVGGLIAVGVAVAVRPRGRRGAAGRSARPHLRAALAVAAGTTVELVRGTWRTVRFCLGDRGRQGFVEIPRAGRSTRNVAFWGLLTGEAPDEVPVDVDTERDILIVHLIDARDPEEVRERHNRASRAQRKVVH